MNTTMTKDVQQNVDRPQLEMMMSRYESASKRRSGWENLWQDCYDYALPQRGNAVRCIQR